MVLSGKLIFKVILIGDGGVGKTTLRRRWMGEGFRSKYMLTVGVEFASKNFTMSNGQEVKFQIWDIAGQERFKEIRRFYYEGTIGAWVVYDVANRKSFENVTNWVQELLGYVGEKVPVVLVGNKIDLRRDSTITTVTTEEGLQLREKLEKEYGLDVIFIETSAKTGENVEIAFKKLAETIIQKLEAPPTCHEAR